MSAMKHSQTQRCIIESVPVSTLEYDLICIRRLFGNTNKFFKFMANLILPTNKIILKLVFL